MKVMMIVPHFPTRIQEIVNIQELGPMFSLQLYAERLEIKRVFFFLSYKIIFLN